MTLLDVLGDLATIRKNVGAHASDMPVVLLMPNGERFEVQSGGHSMSGHVSFLNDAGKYDTRAHICLTIRQIKLREGAPTFTLGGESHV